jgi:hypothetical protein
VILPPDDEAPYRLRARHHMRHIAYGGGVAARRFLMRARRP